MPLTLEEAINQLKGDVSKMPKYLPLSEAEQIETTESIVNSIPEYSDSPFMRFIKGAYVGFDSLKDTLPSLELYGKTADLAIGGYFGASEETINRKAANIATIQRNLMANQKDRYAYLSKETTDSFAFGLGQGAANLLTMWATGGAAGGVAKAVGANAAKSLAIKTGAGIATGTALENIEQQSERMPINEQGELEVEKLTPEWAKKSAIGTTAYLSASALLEKYVGFGKQTTLWETPIKFDNTLLKNASVYAKTAAKGAVSEGVTEGLQSLTSSGILLAEGKIKMSDMPERLQQAWKEAVIGGILGGSVGTAAAVNQQANVKTMLNDLVSGVVSDPQERAAVVDSIYDSGTIEMTNVISKELELSSELNAKHGAIYDSMQTAVHKAIQEAGAFTQESEADVAQYVSQTSKMFANQVLAEANKRSCLIDDVLKASDIRYEDGKIKLQAGKEVIAETEVGGVEETPTKEQTFTQGLTDEQKEAERLAYNVLSVATGYNEKYLKMMLKSTSEKKARQREKIYELARNVADQLTLSSWGPEYLQYFGNVNIIDGDYGGTGPDHTDNLAMVERAFDIIENGWQDLSVLVDNYYKEEAEYYFGILDSVATKFNNAKNFDELNEIYSNIENEVSEIFAEDITKLYIKNIERLENETRNIAQDFRGNEEEVSTSDVRATQRINDKIDSRSNGALQDKTQSEQQEINPDVLYQSAYHGTPHKFDEFSLDAIGTGEGAQAHGWGLYFAGDKNVSEGYRRRLTNFDDWENRKVINKKINQEITKDNNWDIYYIVNRSADFNKNLSEGLKEYEEFLQRQFERYKDDTFAIEEIKKELKTIQEIDIKEFEVTGVEYGQLFEVDIPESDVLLDENKPFSEQSEFVQEAIKELFNKEIKDGQKYLKDFTKFNYDGKGIYNTIREIKALEDLGETLGGSYKNKYDNKYYREASLLLNKYGIKGITYDGMQDGRCYVIFDDKAIKVLETYYQIKGNPKNPEVKRGSYIVSEKAIELFKDADYSTLPHEFAHFWLDNMWSYSRSGAASDAYKNNFQALLDFLGVKDSQIYLTRGQQEKFARAYEKYLLNGYAPNGLIQGAFDEYDKWLQRVYDDARELKVKLTADAIEFFDSMTTGKLEPYSVEETNREVIEKEVPKVIKEAKKVAVEAQAKFNASPINNTTVPVTTEGEKAESKAFARQADILGIAEELNYNKTSIEEQNKKAQEFVRADLAKAQRIVTGVEQAPSDILKNAIYNAYLKEMLTIGNTDAYVEALRNQSLELTRAGQEIASQRGAIENIFDSTYWIRRIENRLKEIKAVEKFGEVLEGLDESKAVARLENYIDTEISKVLDKFVNESAEVQANMVKTLVDKVASELKAKPPEELYQRLREPSEVRTRTNAYNYLYRVVNEGLGLTLSKQQVNEIISKTSDIQKSIENTRDRNGNPSALFFKNMAEMENYSNSIVPSPALSVLTSTVGRGNMLLSLKSMLLNIESNTLNFISESAIKRISYGSIDKVVNPEVIKEYMQYSKDIYNASGYQVSTMEELDATQRILNEKQITSQGEGIIRKLGRGYEQTIFKYGLGYPDLVFKDLAFVDTANLLASKEANGNAEKATAIFKDAILLQPKTKIGQEIREKAQLDALVATYQNNGTIAEVALGIRNVINKATGQLRLGDALSPFVKTPANVIGLGLDYTFGAYALKDIKTIVSDFQRGQITDTSKNALRKIGRNALGVLIALAVASFIDDDDYIPDYALLSQGERNLVKAKNGVFNAVKIGNKWVSLDYFGPFAMPLAAVLNAKREKDLQGKIFNYFAGAGVQALKVPVIGDLKEVLEEAGRSTNQDAQKNMEKVGNALVDFVSSRTIPALVSDVAKITDEYERDTGKSALNRAQAKIPHINILSDMPIVDKIPNREDLPTKVNYATGRAVKTENSASVLFAGARVKEATKGSVINEIDRLYDANTEKNVTLSSVTKGNGALSRLPESEKPRAEAKFARMYADGVAKLIASSRYRNLDDNKKVAAINKIRTQATDKIKKEYGLNRRRSKK